ncbi:MAG: hypothetical protein V7L00_31055 [Nostoc sp.]|uniref:hypothetical protein n=1 Tax=Nostoc sp. TaxID=1180 RepID=UPI002FF70DB2
MEGITTPEHLCKNGCGGWHINAQTTVLGIMLLIASLAFLYYMHNCARKLTQVF